MTTGRERGSRRSGERLVVLGDRYELVRPLASGGMAEIFLARQKALAGFEKELVVKLLKDHYVRDQRVVEMFLEEARIGAELNHPNVVHVYDVGEHHGQPYIAMELIHGEELSQLCRHGLEQGRFLPLEHAVDLVRQTAEGMGYFHHKRRDDGGQMEIVHRDISPSNLLVTTDGVLKIIDFGIAKARTRGGSAAARAEIDRLVPGKYNYMSPEQVRGEPVDHRSDIFSLGIVLYEITVGKRLFKGRPEEVMERIAKGKVKPPTFVRKKFPAALEHVVMRALELHPEDRYPSAYELANDLEEFLRDARLKSGPVRIAKYLDDLRGATGGERRPELVMAGEAWVDDEGEDVLDFDRSFNDAMRESRVDERAKTEDDGPRIDDGDDDEAADTADTAETPLRVPLPPADAVQPHGPPPADPAALAPRISASQPAVSPLAAAPHPSKRSAALLWMLMIVGVVVAIGIGTFLAVR